MSEEVNFPAPELAPLPENKLYREQRAFQRLLPDLMPSLRGQYVAIHNGQVVENGTDQLEVADRAYARFGYVPIYVGLVTDEPLPIIRIPSPRFLRPEKSS
jgi:hypothetical protein